MIILFYGQDTYRSFWELKSTIEDLKKKYPKETDLERYDAKKIDFRGFQDGLQAVSFFSKKKIIILTNVFSTPLFKQEIFNFLKKKKDLEENILFYEEELNEKDKFLYFFKNNFQVKEFKPLEGQKLKEWIVKEFNKYQVEISSEIPGALARFIGNNLWQLSNEIKKIATFKFNIRKKEKVTLEDVALLTESKIETDIFVTIDAFSAKDKKNALRLIHNHLEKGDSPLYLLSMLKFQIGNLLVVKDLIEKQMSFSHILAKSNLHPFVVKKNWRLSQKFTLGQLKQIYQKIFKLELKIKTGKIDPVLALDILIAEL